MHTAGYHALMFRALNSRDLFAVLHARLITAGQGLKVACKPIKSIFWVEHCMCISRNSLVSKLMVLCCTLVLLCLSFQFAHCRCVRM